MSTSNENFDPRSLPNLSNLLTHSAHKRNTTRTANKRTLTSPGLKESILNNVSPHPDNTLENGIQLQFPTLPFPQSIVVSHDKVTEETRLPISPPPEEEIRIKEQGTHGITHKELNTRLPIRSRQHAFKIPSVPQSAHSQQQAHQPAIGPSDQGFERAPPVVERILTTHKPNPRKRTRSILSPRDSTSIPTNPTSSGQSSTIIPSPNPRARKQFKQHDTGVYTGSGFKRRHQRGTSAESLDIVDDRHVMSPASTTLKSPARKKRFDPGIVDYTPERERASTSITRGSSTERKLRAQRSLTPEVRYEPPAEQFTPPREVVLQIPSSTVSSRSRKARQSVSAGVRSSVDRKVVRVKSERLTSPFPLPPLDPTKPVPPPSPTDDPLLLVGPPVILRRSATPAVVPKKTLVDVSVGFEEDIPLEEPSTPVRASPTIAHHFDQSLWSFGPDLTDETALMGVGFDGPSTFDATFQSDNSDAGDVHHNAAENRPHFALAPVRFDPDQSTGSHIFHSDDEDAEAGEDEGEYTGRFKFYSVPVKQDPPSSATKARRESWGRPISPFPFAKRLSGASSPEGAHNRQVLLDEDSPPPSPSAGRRRSALPTQELDVAPSEPSSDVVDQQEIVVEEGRTESESRGNHIQETTGQLVIPPSRSLSSAFSFSPRCLGASCSSYKASQSADHSRPHGDVSNGNTPEPENTHDDGDGFYNKNITSPGVVEVSSDDPKAAARAAAILKLHHSYVVDGDIPQRGRRRSSFTFGARNVDRGHEWTKAHWKILDMCFTDERVAVGSAMGLNNRLAEVDDIEMNSVVERFLAHMEDEDWDRDMLFRRTTALSRRQRAGEGALPSPGRLIVRSTTPEFVVPILTPTPITRTLSPATETEYSPVLPPSLLAPRYAHLHEEVTAAPSTLPEIATQASRSSKDTHESRTAPVESQESSQVSMPQPPGPAEEPSGGTPVLPSAAKRLLSYVGSMMGRGGTIAPLKLPLKPRFNALPLPPPNMRQVTRGPINTPAKRSIPKTQPPRELVHLTETQLPAKSLQFPKAKCAKEMVQLNHVEPPRSAARPRTASGPIIIPGRTRRDSGGSVKDLVKSFEAVQKKTEEEMKRTNSRLGVRKVTSVGSFGGRTIWKP